MILDAIPLPEPYSDEWIVMLNECIDRDRDATNRLIRLYDENSEAYDARIAAYREEIAVKCEAISKSIRQEIETRKNNNAGA